MLGKKKKMETVAVQFEEKQSKRLYEIVCDTLSDILKTESKKQDNDGNAVVDYEMTCRAIKTKARIALDFVTKIENKNE